MVEQTRGFVWKTFQLIVQHSIQKSWLKRVSHGSSSWWFPTAVFITFCRHHQLLLLTVLTNNHRVFHWFFLLRMPLCLSNSPQAPWRMKSSQSPSQHNSQLRHCWGTAFSRLVFYSHLILQLKLSHFFDSSLVHRQLTVTKYNMPFSGGGFCDILLLPPHINYEGWKLHW